MGTLTKEQVNTLPTSFETVPYSTFFKLWYALQKALPPESKGEILTKIGRTIGREFVEILFLSILILLQKSCIVLEPLLKQLLLDYCTII